MFDIKNEMNPDALMITWRLGISPHIKESVIFADLIHFNTNGKLPEFVVVEIIGLESMIAIIWKKDTKLVGRTQFSGC
jgi:hypothetical protein